MNINFSFIAKSVPTIMALAGILMLFTDQLWNTAFGLTPWALIIIGVGVNLVWAGVFKKF